MRRKSDRQATKSRRLIGSNENGLQFDKVLQFNYM